jgi:hypothetical protein
MINFEMNTLEKCIIKEYPQLKKGFKILWLGGGKPDIVITNMNGKHISPIYSSIEKLEEHYGIPKFSRIGGV